METKEKILALLENVTDPEVPVLTIMDLGIVRDVIITGDNIEVVITPTYSGCPAMDMISMDIKMLLAANGWKQVKVSNVLSPSWTTDWMTETGKKKLQEYGIAPPNKKFSVPADGVECPRCHSHHTKLISEFGSTACKSLYQCSDCMEPFDYFKCH